ncbi:MAG: 2-amino-4-hydroxy-6-hydroxymethyldihydropteridine diphosphokinase [Planctomycetota bacterium]
MALSLIGLGSNLGDRSGLLEEALVRLHRHPNIEVARQSQYHETRPVGGLGAQSAYLNAAAVLHTSLSPEALLAELQRVEADLGRQRVEHWGPRTVDLDLLLYDTLTRVHPDLVIPHPRMAWRRFVLEPAAEVAPEMLHPGIGWTIARLLDHLNQTPWYLAIAGPIGVGKSWLAGKIAEKIAARLLAEQFDPSRLEAFYRNPSGHAWQIELEFLEQRARQLALGQPEWTRQDRPTVSDFWFEQSPAFASVWLHEEQMPAYLARWAELRTVVVRPRLTVLLRAPMETLLARIQTRGRPGEELLTLEQLRQIEHALDNQAAVAEGPVLRLDAANEKAALVELVAAVEAMR